MTAGKAAVHRRGATALIVALLAPLLLAIPGAGGATPTLSDEERAYLDAHGPLRFVVGFELPPAVYTDAHGTTRGYAVDVLQLMSVRLDLSVQVVRASNFTTALAMVRNGSADVIGPLSPTAQRDEFLDFTDPWTSGALGFWVLEERRDLETPRDLAGRRVAVLGWGQSALWLEANHPGAIPVRVETTDEALAELTSGRADALLGGVGLVAWRVRNEGLENIRPLGEPSFTAEAAWAVREGDASTLAILTKGMASVGAPDLTEIFLKWTGYDLRVAAPDENIGLTPGVRTTLAIGGGLTMLLAVALLVLREEVTARTRDLSHSETRLRALVEHATDLIARYDASGRYLDASPSSEALLGYKPNELIGGNAFDLVHPDDRAALDEAHHALSRGAPVARATYRKRHKAGHYVWLETTAGVLRDRRTREVVEIIGVVRDVTERKRAEADLQAHAHKQAVIAALGQEALTGDNPDALVARAVALTASTLGADLCGVFELRPSEAAFILTHGIGWTPGAVGRERVSASADNQVGYTVEVDEAVTVPDLGREMRFDGGGLFERHGAVAGATVAIRSGTRTFGVLAVHTRAPRRFTPEEANFLQAVANILASAIERRAAEEALATRAAELARSNAELERFAYVASHDLKEPLRMVSSYVQLLDRRYRGRLDEQADEFIAFAVEGARRMHELIEDLLTYARVGREEPTLAPVPLQGVFDHVVATLLPTIEAEGATVTHDPLPAVLAERTQVGQLIQNLLGNALKFRAENPPHVHLSAQREEDEWHFQMRDNGIGIAPEHHERIFVIFQRLHTRDRYDGNGVGLAICKKIVEQHGGSLWVESEPGVGSTFHFTLPAAPEGATVGAVEVRVREDTAGGSG